MNRYTRFAALALVMLSSCASCSTHTNNQPDPDPEWCRAAETNLDAKQCKKSDGSPMTEIPCNPNMDAGEQLCEKDGAWTAMCKSVQEAGIPLEAECLAKLTDCADIETKCNWTSGN